MATARTLSKLAASKPKLPRSLGQELGLHVLDKCREIVEEYSELSRRAPEAFPFSDRDLLTWYAEMRYKLLGAGRCSMCGAHVRHALPVLAEFDERTVLLHTCLCPQCLDTQRSVARRVRVCLRRPALDMPTTPAERLCA